MFIFPIFVCFYPRGIAISHSLLLILEARFLRAHGTASPLPGYLQAFGRAGMPEPLDVRRWDSVGCAVQGLSAPPWY